MTKTIALVSCVGKKLSYAAPAGELYCSQWFKKASAYARQEADDWYILSARYGLLPIDRVVEPYNVTLNKMPASERREWAKRVLTDLRKIIEPGDRIIILAGAKYRENLVGPIVEMGLKVEVPMQGLGIGQQNSWLKKQIGDSTNE